MKKAKRHYEPWSIEEARSFLDYYLSNVTRKEYSILIETFAKEVDRTYDAIAFRVKEILSILTEGDQGLQKDKWTKEFITVIGEKLKEGTISKSKMIMLFE
tara:strand:+ start:86 stop:388 length:303 start_codon:yes stop_codon:yes gene_type:complete